MLHKENGPLRPSAILTTGKGSLVVRKRTRSRSEASKEDQIRGVQEVTNKNDGGEDEKWGHRRGHRNKV